MLALPAFWLGSALSARAAPQQGEAATRIASLNWAMSETLYALGIKPVCAAEINGYDRLVGYPATPEGVPDVGFQGDPNLEFLSSLKPDLILIQSWQAMARPALERFARVESFSIYNRGQGDPVDAAREAATRISALAGCPDKGEALLIGTDTIFRDCATRLNRNGDRAVLLVQALSPTNLVVFTGGSLFDSVMKRIGLTNAWSRPPTLLWGSTQIGVDALADYPDADIVWMASPDGGTSQALFKSDLWRQLPQVANGAVRQLPLVWGFGALPTAERFARLITAQLTGIAG
ncbi:ABC transporter substrate-binding protein [Neorhizobium sp. NCHU2750]|uniref:ABC transporter substrate-binding protein n=1 Tax=Neorhizobium sp. NCHU2750 TaxID=1825976 RepID=UPI000EB71B9A|nr:iron ABC transporter substrate-binding protein [Neorhizobium sp. NCHU2750]